SCSATSETHTFPYTTLFRSLALAAGQLHAAFADHGVIALRQVADEFVGGRVAGGGQDRVLAGIRAAIGDVGADRVVEQHHLLARSEEHTSELQSRENLVCRL